MERVISCIITGGEYLVRAFMATFSANDGTVVCEDGYGRVTGTRHNSNFICNCDLVFKRIQVN